MQHDAAIIVPQLKDWVTSVKTSSNRSSISGMLLGYKTIIAVVAVLCVGLPWCRTGPIQYHTTTLCTIANQVVGPKSSSDLKAVTNDVLQRALSEEKLASYIQTIPNLAGDLAESESLDLVEELKRQLEMQMAVEPTGATISLGFHSAAPETGQILMDHILQDIKVQLGVWKQEKISTIQSNFEPQLKKARLELAKIEKQISAINTDAVPEPKSAGLDPPTPKESPAWITVATELNQLKQKRIDMLSKMTEAHPMVVDLQDRIAQQQERLDQMERYLPNEIPPEQIVLKPAHGKSIEEQQAELIRLRREHDRAAKKVASLESVADQAQGALRIIHGFEFFTTGSGPRIAATGGFWKPTSVALVLCWAGLLGLVTYQLAWLAGQPIAIPSLQRLVSLSPLPVIASVSFANDVNHEHRMIPSGPASFILCRFSELTLIGLVCLILLAWQSDPGFGRVLAADPIGAIRTAVEIWR